MWNKSLAVKAATVETTIIIEMLRIWVQMFGTYTNQKHYCACWAGLWHLSPRNNWEGMNVSLIEVFLSKGPRKCAVFRQSLLIKKWLYKNFIK